MATQKKQFLTSEDWKKIYKSVTNSDFQSYDFETLKRVMISYLQENYPEDFNDYIESSEYIALVDLIAYLGQNLSFRLDLNARENFLETAQRRDSILRLAQLISYNPSRNFPANGFLKIVSLSTTDSVLDLNGNNLANTTILWNDFNNPQWYQQFLTILNSSMTTNFGRSPSRKTIDGILTELYAINTANEDVPIYNFSTSIDGTNMTFDICSATFEDKDYIYELPPKPNNPLTMIYQNDNKGSGSANTGFFFHFRQGTLNVSSFNITTPLPNEIIGVNVSNINNTDIWLWQLDKDGNYDTLWTKVDAVTGSNVIYNSISKNIKTLYAVSSRNSDQIDLNFADGIFGQLPKGQFRLFYRQSNGLTYTITPDLLSGIIISVPYLNSSNQLNTLQITLSLQYVVANAQGAESNSDIRAKAPQNYYLQNRMVTGEDYNIAPLSAGPDILKVKSINRISSGISRYFDLSDVSGYYSKTNIFGSDGILFKEENEQTINFSFNNRLQALTAIKRSVADIVASSSMKSFYNEKFAVIDVANLNLQFRAVNRSSNESRGYFFNESGNYVVGYDLTDNNLRYISVGAQIKFEAPEGRYFDKNNNIQTISDESDLGFDLLKFVSAARGSYSFKDYYVKTLNILPLYTGNASYTINNAIRYGLFRDPDFEGLKFWVNLALTENKGIDDAVFRNLFFTKIPEDSIDSYRSKSQNKIFFSVSQVITGFTGSEIYYQLPAGGKRYIWANIVRIVGDGATILDDGTGPIIFDVNIPDSAVPTQIIATYKSILPFDLENEISVQCNTFRNFGLTINKETRQWEIIVNSNLNLLANFSLDFQENASDQNLDASWLIAFVWNGTQYNVRYRVLEYIFESKNETAFFLDSSQKNYDYVTNEVIKDSIDILALNLSPLSSTVAAITIGNDRKYQIDGSVIESDGYVYTNRVRVSLYSNSGGVISDPKSFDDIVGDNYVLFKRYNNTNEFRLSDENFIILETENNLLDDDKVDQQLFYIKNLKIVKYWSSQLSSLVFTDSYICRSGRSNLKFHYVHNSGNQFRLDPSKTNIIEIYILTTSYHNEFVNYIKGRSSSMPLPPSISSLEQNYKEYLEEIKSISDEIIFHPVRYKILFGNKADLKLQAIFKAVRNSNRTTNDNNLKSRILLAIDEYFAIENWDFGQTFYFSELATYVMNSLDGDIVNFILVPILDSGFGSLYEIKSLSDEIFVNGTTIENIEIISAVTASQLKTDQTIITST
ncbi:MAG: hypothetical protein EBX47_05895 [Synechococcaceae bacterium WB8_1B_057]|nr:hypothetical protein [Synechococcaceae bacterium WB8_1B_057]